MPVKAHDRLLIKFKNDKISRLIWHTTVRPMDLDGQIDHTKVGAPVFAHLEPVDEGAQACGGNGPALNLADALLAGVQVSQVHAIHGKQ